MSLDFLTNFEDYAHLGIDRETFRVLQLQLLSKISQVVLPNTQGIVLTPDTVNMLDNTNTALIAADAVGDRRIVWVQNPSNSPVFLNHSDPAALDENILLPAGGIYQFGTGEWQSAQGAWGIQNSGGAIDVFTMVGVLA
jgi:hypothetical protein